MSSLRQFYISQGVLRPDQPTEWVSNKITLRLDEVGKAEANEHIYEYEYNKYFGVETEFPQEQLPECVLEYWEANGSV